MALDHIRSAGMFAYDTEFIGEETYFPELCLIQLSTEEELFLVDPLAVKDLNPVWELLADPDILTIVHAGQQDLEPVFRHLGRTAMNIIDTQIAAGLAGMPYPSSLNRLILAETDVAVGKGMTFTRWDNRPLSPMQCRYAADDVRYLPLIWSRMKDRLESRGHLAWVQEESEILCREQTYRPDFTAICNRLQRNRTLRPNQRSLLHRLVEARDEAARESNLPPRTLMADDLVLAVMKHRPDSAESLAQLPGMPKALARNHGDRLLRAIRSEDPRPVPTPRARLAEETLEQRMSIDCLWAVVTVTALARGVSPALLWSRNQLAAWVLQQDAVAPLVPPDLPGWRGVFLADALADVLSGERTLQLHWRDGLVHRTITENSHI